MVDVVSFLTTVVTPVGIAIASSIATYAIMKLRIRNHPLILKEIMGSNNIDAISTLPYRINSILNPSIIKENMSIMIDCSYINSNKEQLEILMQTEMSFIIRNISRTTQIYKFSLDEDNIDARKIRVIADGKRHSGDYFENNSNIDDLSSERIAKSFKFSIDPAATVSIRVNFESIDNSNVLQFFRQSTMVAPGSRIIIRSSLRKPVDVIAPSNLVDMSPAGSHEDYHIKYYDISEPLIVGDLIVLHSQ